MGTIGWAIIALVVGAAVGAGAVWLGAVRRAGPMSVSEMKKENERFREEVNAHFVQSAELINELTDSYKKVFDHLSDGADRLVDSEAVRERMPQVGRAEVRLRHIGAPKDFSAGGGVAPMEGSAGKTAKPAPVPESKERKAPNAAGEGSKATTEDSKATTGDSKATTGDSKAATGDAKAATGDSEPQKDEAPAGERDTPSGKS